jgi:hypothetical protein
LILLLEKVMKFKRKEFLIISYEIVNVIILECSNKLNVINY